MVLWKVRVLKPSRVLDAGGRLIDAPVGRLAWLEQEAAIRAVATKSVEILSPDGMHYNTRVQVAATQAPAEPVAASETEAAEESIPETPKLAARRPRAPYTTRT